MALFLLGAIIMFVVVLIGGIILSAKHELPVDAFPICMCPDRNDCNWVHGKVICQQCGKPVFSGEGIKINKLA